MIYFWRSKGGAEVDFVRQRGDVLEGFEAKAGRMDRPKLSRSAWSFIEAYSPETFFVINLNLCTETLINSTKIKWVTPLEFMDLIHKTG